MATCNLVLLTFTVPLNNVVVSSLSSGRLRAFIPHSPDDQALILQGAEALCPHSYSPRRCSGVGGLHPSAKCRWRPSGCYGNCRGASPFFLVTQHLTHRLSVRDRRQLRTKAMLMNCRRLSPSSSRCLKAR